MELPPTVSGRDHRVGRAVDDVLETLIERSARLIAAGRRTGAIPPGPSARTLALAIVGATEGMIIQLAGRAPHDELLAERVVLGVLGVR